jgi:protein-L-isoaspartate(D-aspartate) O-methyltransferase
MRETQKGQSGTLDYTRAREKMVQEQIVDRGIRDPRVIEAMRKIPRHLFVPDALLGRAYGDTALPIGDSQTITQPFMVAFMSEALGLGGKERVLEVGTGSGYQAAVLACLAERVYSVERIPSLLERARKTLDRVNCLNVVTKLSDGSYGWQEEAPFNAILITAGAPSLPQPLMDQLKTGGIMVIPVGERNGQRLIRVRKNSRGFSQEELLECNFVSLVGEFGWAKREKWSPY